MAYPMYFIFLIQPLYASDEEDNSTTDILIRDCYLPSKIPRTPATSIGTENSGQEEDTEVFQILHSHDAKLEDLERRDRIDNFFKSINKVYIRDLLRDKILKKEEKAPMYKKPMTSESYCQFIPPEYSKGLSSKDRFFAGLNDKDSPKHTSIYSKPTSQGKRPESHGLYSKGKKILVRSPYYKKSKRSKLSTKMKRGYSLYDFSLTMQKNIYKKNSPRECLSVTSFRSLKHHDRTKTPDVLPETEFFLNMKIPSLRQESCLSKSRSYSCTGSVFSLSTGDIERADSTLSWFDQDIFDNLSNFLSSPASKKLYSISEEQSKGRGREDKQTSTSSISFEFFQSQIGHKQPPAKPNEIPNNHKEPFFKVPKAVQTSPKDLKTDVILFGFSPRWSPYEKVYNRFKLDRKSAGPIYSYSYKICRFIEILERNRDDSVVPVKFKFNYGQNAFNSYLSNEIKNEYIYVNDFKDHVATESFKDLIVFLADIYAEKEIDIGFEVERICRLMVKCIKSSMELYNNINLEIQRQKNYRYLIPEVFIVEIILKKGKYISKTLLLKTYGLLITINRLSKKLFPSGCDLSAIIKKYTEEHDLYIRIIKKIYECYRTIICFKSKKSFVVSIHEKFDYNPNIKSVYLMNSILLCLDIMHPFTANSLTKFFDNCYGSEITIIKNIISDRYVCLELILMLSLVLYDDTLNFDFNGDGEMLSWFRFYVETFGCQLKEEDIFQCLIYMAQEIIGSTSENHTP